MKNSKIFILLVALTLVLASVLAIGVSAEDEKVLKLDSANVAYNDMMHLVFTLENTDVVPDGADAGIIVWDEAKEEYTVSNAAFATFTARTDGETTYYRSYGIAAPEIGTELRIAACYMQDEAITVTQEPITYSLVEYFVNGLNKNSEAYQVELYESVLSYGAASDTVLNDEDAFVLVRANGGYVGSYNRAVGAAKNVGESFTLRAPITNEAGEFFSKWVNNAGETVSADRVCTVTPETAGISAYTAVYGGDATYKSGFGFEDLATGEVNVGTPDLTNAPTLTAQGAYSGTNYKVWNVTKTIDNISYTRYLGPVATKDAEGVYTFTQDEESGKYAIDKYDSFHIVQDDAVNKVLSVHRDLPANGWSTVFTNVGASTNKATCAEVDLRYDTFAKDNVQHHVSITVYNGTKYVTYRSNLFDKTGESSYIYAENTNQGSGGYSTRAVKDEAGETKYFDHAAGETFTFGAEFVNRTETVEGVETTVSYIDYYINGEYFGSLPLSLFGTHSGTLADGKFYITDLRVVSISSARDSISIDNVCFR